MELVSTQPSCGFWLCDVGKELTYIVGPRVEGREYTGMPVTGSLGVVEIDRKVADDLGGYF
jgi:hypothetical protein